MKHINNLDIYHRKSNFLAFWMCYVVVDCWIHPELIRFVYKFLILQLMPTIKARLQFVLFLKTSQLQSYGQLWGAFE